MLLYVLLLVGEFLEPGVKIFDAYLGRICVVAQIPSEMNYPNWFLH